MTERTFSLSNSPDLIGRTISDAERWLEESGVPLKPIYAANLALEEFLTNIVKYGYDDDAPHTIQVSIRVFDDCLCLAIIDDGHPFDPLQAAEPDARASLDERAIGGLGIHLVRNLSRRLGYRRQNDLNIVEIDIAI